VFGDCLASSFPATQCRDRYAQRFCCLANAD
jgi:hypothetical protein